MNLQKLIDGLKAHKSGAASYESVDEAIRVFEAMRNMDEEKVCKGLEHCKTEDCSGCPYEDTSAPVGKFGTDELVACQPVLYSDALSMIRQQRERITELEAAQTARVMSLEEANEADAVWIEVLGNVRIIPARIHVLDGVAIVFKFIATQEKASLESYGADWRCWTQRPTDEQRRATPWKN